jgi:hypothetical protein
LIPEKRHEKENFGEQRNKRGISHRPIKGDEKSLQTLDYVYGYKCKFREFVSMEGASPFLPYFLYCHPSSTAILDPAN